MDVTTPTSLMMDFSKGHAFCPQSPPTTSAFEVDFLNGAFFNEEDDLLSSLYNKTQAQSTNNDVLLVDEDNTFTSLSNIVNEKSLPDSPESWVSNSSTSDNDEDLELIEFTSAGNVQKANAKTTKPTKTKQQPPVMNAPITAPFMNFGQPQMFQPNMMEAYMTQQMMPNMMPMVSPQQLMFLQQQQLAFNAMQTGMNFTPNFVPTPAPTNTTTTKKQAKSPPLKQERASPSKNSNLKRRRDTIVDDEEAKKSPARDSPHSSPSSSPSTSPTPNDSETKPKDKDVKRQRRLIKNRESAQASRERKKIYVQGLEKRVDDLAQTNTALSSKVLTLEEENILLREKLMALDRDGSIQKELNEPINKRRRLEQPKIPIPSLQTGSSMNPFTSGFWNAFMSFAPPHMQPSAQPQPTSWNPTAQSKKVVLFVMLFCVAVLVFSNRKNGVLEKPSVLLKEKDGMGSINLPQETHYIGRKILTSEIEEENISFNTRIKPIMEEFFANYYNETVIAGDEEEEEEQTKNQCPKEDGEGVKMEFDEHKGLILTFPISKLSQVKTEEGITLTREMKMDQLSQRFVQEICRELKH